MKVWCFKSDDNLWALTGEASGAQLPAVLGPWNLHKEAELHESVDDEREAQLDRGAWVLLFSRRNGVRSLG